MFAFPSDRTEVFVPPAPRRGMRTRVDSLIGRSCPVRAGMRTLDGYVSRIDTVRVQVGGYFEVCGESKRSCSRAERPAGM